jgi:mono/diheme cytochrome c family protein
VLRAARVPFLSLALSACSGPAAPPVAADRGAQVYEGICMACHQRDGRGVANLYPSLAGSPVVNGDPAALLRWVMKGERPPSMPAGRSAAVMPPYGWLKDADAAALLTHVRSNFGNRSPAMSAADVARALGR